MDENTYVNEVLLPSFEKAKEFFAEDAMFWLTGKRVKELFRSFWPEPFGS